MSRTQSIAGVVMPDPIPDTIGSPRNEDLKLKRERRKEERGIAIHTVAAGAEIKSRLCLAATEP